MSTANNWHTTWNDLDKTLDGKQVEYTVQEMGDLKGYSSTLIEISNGQFVLTNTHVPDSLSVKGNKTWVDKENEAGARPESIMISLLANGRVVDRKQVSEKENWKYEFMNLPKYSEGKKIQYHCRDSILIIVVMLTDII
ncbi:MAG: Cna B-type domain-containing protein [Enterococcus sp.]|uniref:Cna B-type domain-containing protein n=1 Tax=Enterococcus sp. TaxID=35783 RepID=UPI0039957E03